MRPEARPRIDVTDVWIVSTARLEAQSAALCSLAGEDGPRAPARGFLRVLLSATLGVPPDELRIERRCPACGGAHGPPTCGGLSISVSYTDGRVAYALSQGPVGIDVERVRPGYPWARVAPLVFGASEPQRFADAAPDDRDARFFGAWTRREALGKATGEGLLGRPTSGWGLAIEDIHVDPGYTAAVAHASRTVRVHSGEMTLTTGIGPHHPRFERRHALR